ncbi:hypothetical protein GCK72_015663 [Caenorhabditis remanei]|uniref:Galectin n=1 Tax=Caenorhabditis remanei TaxID=31234 RepID=A0A6A5GY09_CAERE|nr:hypothetical protein GCK72_015663 [Caenorhabditis remanei]KAF1759202.1 hypothetical protein GCK72_015663 [Caenorhabditis remanei]
MIVVYGTPKNFATSQNTKEKWEDCVQKCLDSWNCVLVYQLPNGCQYFNIPNIATVTKSVSGQRVAFKKNLPSAICPAPSKAPPLFGNVSSSLIIRDGSDNYYKSEITETPTTWNFSYSAFKCTKDIPKDYGSFEKNYTGGRYSYPITGPFSAGETFFVVGKTPKDGNEFTISFFYPPSAYPIHIRITNGVLGQTTINIATWNNDKQLYILENLTNPYTPQHDFEIRINSTDTVANVYLNTTLLQYPLKFNKEVPMSKTTQFIINDSAQKFQNVIIYYIGWSGNCWYEPMN